MIYLLVFLSLCQIIITHLLTHIYRERVTVDEPSELIISILNK